MSFALRKSRSPSGKLYSNLSSFLEVFDDMWAAVVVAGVVVVSKSVSGDGVC
jgi:hypothetical protein